MGRGSALGPLDPLERSNRYAMRLRLSRRAGLITVLLLVFCLGLFSFGLFPQDPLRRLAEQRLRAAVGPRCRIGQLHVIPIRLAVSARDVVLASDGFELSIERGSAALSLDALLGRALSLRSLTLHRPLLRLNSAPASDETPPLALPPIVLKRVLVTDGRFIYAGAKERFDLSGIEVRGGMGEGRLDVRVRHGQFLKPRRIDIESLHARLMISPRLALVIESFEGATRGSRLSVDGRLGSLLDDWSPDLRFSGTIALDELSPPAPQLHGAVFLEGRLSKRQDDLEWNVVMNGARLDVAGWTIDRMRASLSQSSDAGLRARAKLEMLSGGIDVQATMREKKLIATLAARRLRFDQRTLPAAFHQAGVDFDASARGRLDGRLTTLISARATTHIGRDIVANIDAESSGWLNPTRQTTDMKFKAVTDARPRHASDTPMSIVRATLTLNGRAAGALNDLSIESVLEGLATIATPSGGRHVEIAGELRRVHDRLTSRIEALGVGDGARLELEATAGHVRNLAIKAANVNLAEILPEWSGKADWVLEASGPPQRLAGHSQLSIRDASWRFLDIGSATAAYKGTASDGRLSLRVPAFNVAGDGDLRLGRRPILNASISFERFPLSPFAALVERPLEGTLSGLVVVALPLDRPEKLRVETRLSALNASSERLDVRLERPLVVRLDETTIAIDDLALLGPAFLLETHGASSRLENGPLDLSVKLSADLARLPYRSRTDLAGEVAADIRLRGSRKSPSATGTILLSRVNAGSPKLPPLALDSGRITLDGDAFRFDDLAAAFANGTLKLHGRLPFESLRPRDASRPHSAEADVDIEWSGIEAARILASLAPRGVEGGAPRINARLSGRLHIGGRPTSLESIRARLVFNETPLTIEEAGVVISQAILTMDGGVVHTDGVALDSEQGEFSMRGDVDLLRRRLDVGGDGALNLRMLSPFLSDMAFGGRAEAHVAVGGSFDSPDMRGSVDIKDGLLRFRELRQPLTAIDARLQFDRAAIRLRDASASFGGGALTLDGGARLEGGGVTGVRLDARARDVALHYPPGLRSRLDAEVALTGRSGALRLTGRIASQRALFDRDLMTEETLFASVPEATASPLLRSIGLDLAIDTATPLRMNNDVARLEAKGTLVIRGTMETPEPYGALDVVVPGGKFFFQGQEYSITEGQIAYRGDWEPVLRLSAETYIEKQRQSEPGNKRIDRYLVRVNVNGTVFEISQAWTAKRFGLQSPDQIRDAFSATSDSITDEQQLLDELFGRRADQHALSLLAGRISRGLAADLRKLGLDEVSIEPQLVARETDPGARFTFGKNLTDDVDLVYSTSLGNAERSFVKIEARPGWNVAITIQRQIEGAGGGAFTYGAGQRIRLGGPRRDKAFATEERITIRALTFEGCPACETEAFAGVLELKVGDRVTPFELQDAAERLRSRLAKDGYIEAAVSAHHVGDGVVFKVRAGRRYDWRVEGISNHPDLESEIKGALFEEEAVDRGIARLLDIARRRGHPRARVETRVENEDETRRLVFIVESGPRMKIDDVRFPGAHSLSRRRLLKACGGAAELLVAPDHARAAISDAYRRIFHLRAQVGEPVLHESVGRVAIEVPIDEGEAARASAVVFDGATLPVDDLIDASGLVAGEPFDPVAVERAIVTVIEHYAKLGHSDARVSLTTSPAGDGDLDLRFTVIEGPRLLLQAIEIEGLTRTSEALVRRRVPLKIGEPLDPRRMAETERCLRGLGIFDSVVVRRDPQRPDVVRIELRESPILIGGYDLRYENRGGKRRFTDNLSALADVELRNFLGSAFTVGGRHQIGQALQESRVSLHGPLPIGGSFTGSVFRQYETLPPTSSDGEPVDSDTRGLSFQHSLDLPDRWALLYGFRLKRVRIFDFSPVNVASAELSLLRDSRDNPLDARRGRFLSLNLTLSHPRLGSSLSFLKGFGQAFVMRRLGENWTWAQGYRLGLAHVFREEPLVAWERFRAGGVNSLRGFAAESVGPRDILGDPRGGQAVVVLNQELRYHHRSGLGLCFFYDTGEVFPSIGEMRLDFRHTAGVGPRWNSPIGLLRLDLGFPLDREGNEAKLQYFFSLGQAF
ncbi:MAG: translocation/assembly module TamB domain-containing protein [Vicinamibacteria bacterium]|nr:translocation/assembly module TamB domain-containing protein [Vicinamibacteria bacterium]